MEKLFSILVLITSITLIVATTLLESKQQGMGAITGQASSLFGKNRGQTKDDILNRIIVIAAIGFFVSNLVLLANI